jgi:hypothetical protein
VSAHYVDVVVPADPDMDDCLAGAEQAYLDEHRELRGYDLSPRWTDDDRETVTLSVPEWSLRIADSDPDDEAACIAEMRAEHEADARRMAGDE